MDEPAGERFGGRRQEWEACEETGGRCPEAATMAAARCRTWGAECLRVSVLANPVGTQVGTQGAASIIEGMDGGGVGNNPPSQDQRCVVGTITILRLQEN